MVFTGAVQDFKEAASSFQRKWIRSILRRLSSSYSFCYPFLSVSLVLLFREILPQEGPMVTNEYDMVNTHLLGT